ncbi:MAG TPA: phosphate ABC transporter substrate-binding protein [Syntrophaceticus sp.]|nr:phosphate ABC transporter substrate-binding protein [Syntrophaceticus sp.]
MIVIIAGVRCSLWGVLLIGLLILAGLPGCSRPDPENTINIAGSSSVQPLSEELANAFMEDNPGIYINVAGGGSSAGIKAAKDGTADIGASSRELSKDEEKGLLVIPIAIDGIAIVVNPENPVKNLTLEQIQGIYAGEITNWKEVGGREGDINAFTREEGSGTRGAFEELVMKGSRISSKVGVQNSTGSLRTAVAGDPQAVAYISLGNVNDSVKVLAVEGVTPRDETIKNGSYKLARYFYYLTKEQPREIAKQFIDFVLSPEGQQIVGEVFVPVK